MTFTLKEIWDDYKFRSAALLYFKLVWYFEYINLVSVLNHYGSHQILCK